jgi:hypothetical protein
MTYTDIILKSLYCFHKYHITIENNEEKIVKIINKKKCSLGTSIDNYITDYYNNYCNFSLLFNDKHLKKLIKDFTIYNETLILLENKNKEIYQLKQKLEKYELK